MCIVVVFWFCFLFFLHFSSSITADMSCILLVLQTSNAKFRLVLASKAILVG